jgi:hypothetical protein
VCSAKGLEALRLSKQTSWFFVIVGDVFKSKSLKRRASNPLGRISAVSPCGEYAFPSSLTPDYAVVRNWQGNCKFCGKKQKALKKGKSSVQKNKNFGKGTAEVVNKISESNTYNSIENPLKFHNTEFKLLPTGSHLKISISNIKFSSIFSCFVDWSVEKLAYRQIKSFQNWNLLNLYGKWPFSNGRCAYSAWP